MRHSQEGILCAELDWSDVTALFVLCQSQTFRSVAHLKCHGMEVGGCHEQKSLLCHHSSAHMCMHADVHIQQKYTKNPHKLIEQQQLNMTVEHIFYPFCVFAALLFCISEQL